VNLQGSLSRLLKYLAWMQPHGDRTHGKADFDANSPAIREESNADLGSRLRAGAPRQVFQQPVRNGTWLMWQCMKPNRLHLLVLVLCILPTTGQGQELGRPAITISAQRGALDREAVEVQVHAEFDAMLAVIWGALTDYDRLDTFVPGIQSSRLLERRGNQVKVSQKGQAKLAFFSFPIDVVWIGTELEPYRIDAKLESGNLKRMEGGYVVTPLPDQGPLRHRLEWKGVIEPKEALPPLIGMLMLRKNIETQFDGMVHEILRRQALLAKVPLDSVLPAKP
jgi:ribosome-associated toxin RatA of RatAB toxin-antitoxin module